MSEEGIVEGVRFLDLEESKGDYDSELARRMWSLHQKLARGEGWKVLLWGFREEIIAEELFENIGQVAAIIWEGESEFFHTVFELEDSEIDPDEVVRRRGGIPRALGCFLAREASVREGLRQGRAAIRARGEGRVECLLPIRGEEFLGVFFWSGEPKKGSLEEGLCRLHDLFESPGVQLIRRHQMRRSLRSYQEETRYFRDRERQHYLFKDLVCESDAMATAYDSLSERADDNDPLWITGEAGTGKQLLGRALHHLGGRSEAMLIKMDCANFPAELVGIELFGCVATELVGAVAPRKGIFELGDQGTVFLDEIDCLELSTQGKLVRLLKEREVRRIGDVVGRPVTARIIASSHRDLERLTREGRFRQDLLELLRPHRLNVPALRERREDILPLAEVFLGKFCDRYEASCERFSDELVDWMRSYNWPGNVRQLQTFIEAAVLMSADQEVIETSRIPFPAR